MRVTSITRICEQPNLFKGALEFWLNVTITHMPPLDADKHTTKTCSNARLYRHNFMILKD